MTNFQREQRAAGGIGVDHDQVVLHLDNDVVAVAEVGQIALAEPDAGNDEIRLTRLSLGAGRQKCHGGENGEAGHREPSRWFQM